MTHPVRPSWTREHDTLVGVADHAIDDGLLDTASDVLRFFEKPWNYQELYEAWYDAQGVVYEAKWVAP